jgi:hypothetical protein
MKARAEAEHQEGIRFGTVGTPSIFVNGRYVRSVATTEELRDKIVEELKRAEEALRAGVTREKLYEHLVSEGKPSA